MANLTISGDTSGSVTLTAPAIAGSPVVTLPSATGTVALTSQVYGNSTVTSGTTNITLTSASTRVQNVSFTAADKSVTLPDATTMQLGGPHFTIYNAGPYSFDIKTNGGYSIAYSNPGDTYELSLISQSTANGLWVDTVRGAARLGYITQAAPNVTYFNTVNDPGRSKGAIKAVPLTSNSVLLSYSTSATACNAIVATWSGSSWSYGSPVVLSSTTADSVLNSVALTATTGLLGVDEGAAEVFYPFSVSGTTISIGTKSADCNLDDALAVTRLSNTTAIFNDDAGLRVVYYNGLSAPVLGAATAVGAMTTAVTYSMIDGTNGLAYGSNATPAGRAASFTVSNTTITSNTGVTWAGQAPIYASFCYTSGGGDFYTISVAQDDPNLASAFYIFTIRTGTYSGSTVTQTGGLETLIDFQYPPLLGLPIMATNTSGIFVSTISPQLASFDSNRAFENTIRDFSTIIPQNYQSGAGFSTNGIGYRNPSYTIFDAKPLSSTRYVIVSDNSKWAVFRSIDSVLESPTLVSNGTSWYLTIADPMS